MSNCKIIFIADVVGKPGRNILSHMARRLKYKYKADLVIANTENAAGGFGITPEMARKVFAYGVDLQTSGNHLWDRPGMSEYLDSEPRLIRPGNYPEAKGNGIYVYREGEVPIAVMSLMGRTFMANLDCPFRTADRLINRIPEEVGIIIVDMHAEATSEKEAMWFFLDGRVSAVVGTHTHVQTADEQVSPRGTAYITDVGMTGPFDSILGMKKAPALKRFLSGRAIRLSVAEDDVRISGVVIDVDPERQGRAVAIERFCMPADLSMPVTDPEPEEDTVDAGEAD
jgi:metallophosphoesterase (TIGR00282 family)